MTESNRLTIDSSARLTELAQTQKGLDDAMAQLAAALPEREVRALGFRINELLAAFARATSQQNKLLRNALQDLHELYAETDRTLDAEEVCGRVQELLYCSEYRAEIKK